jgi:hypothetical protein
MQTFLLLQIGQDSQQATTSEMSSMDKFMQ